MESTHEVTNQPPPLTGYDVFGADAALVEAFERHGFAGHHVELESLGRLAGSAEAQQWAVEADRHSPVLRTHDRYGNRVDEVDFHPSWHRLMHTAVEHRMHAGPWADAPQRAHATRAAKFLVWSQLEAAHLCPVSMTYAAIPALRTDPAVGAVWESRLNGAYDPGLRPPAEKAGCLAGMAMTEKQGGSDVRANTTRAEPDGSGGWYRLTGHKWFCSAPMNDVFLVLAQAPDGVSCFVLPRVLDDGTRNAMRLQRLKDKLGNRANASAEVEFDGALAQRLGPEGRGVATIIEMVAATRLDCVLGSAALLRRSVAEATWHAAHRSAFGARLADSQLMRAVLADLALESEAATALGLRLAASVDRADDPHERALRRIGLPLAKYWVCKRTPAAVAEALECLGGNGYVEESAMPRLYREAPLNSIWEGAGNIQALDLLRVLAREPDAVAAWRAEVEAAKGHDRRLDDALASVMSLLPGAIAGDGAGAVGARAGAAGAAASDGAGGPGTGAAGTGAAGSRAAGSGAAGTGAAGSRAAGTGAAGTGAAGTGAAGAGVAGQARVLAGRMAVLLQASLLVRYAPSAVADAFCASRLDARHGVYGALPAGLDTAAIVRRATPEVP